MSRLLFFLILALMAILVGCRGQKSDAPSPAAADTLSLPAVPDTVADTATVNEPAPPPAADGVFDDFVFNFIRNRKFQRQRVRFPLPVTSGGERKMMQASEWRHDRVFPHEDIYGLLFDSPRAMKKKAYIKKDSVVISVLNAQDVNVKHYIFNKSNGAWMLTALDTKSVREEEGADFMSFLTKFSSDASFRRSHVASSFDLIVCDPDTYESMQGIANASQWDDYAPELPTDKLALITYGGLSRGGNERILQLTSLDGAMSSLITFRKQGGRWVAVKLENN